MTSTSFNPVQIQQNQVNQNQSITLKPGQVFHGTIKKLYPDQMAEIQVGGQKLFAKLETPLKAGDSHFFQVTNMNPQAELKVVTGPMNQSQTSAQQISQLLESMNLPKTGDMQKVLSHFIKNQIPIAKEPLLQAEQWIKNLPDGFSKQDAVAVIQKMVSSKMPFTNEVFHGLLYGAKTTGISAEISTFLNSLANDGTVPSNVKSSIMQSLQTIAKPFESETSGMVLGKAVQTLLNSNESTAAKIEMLQLLKEANILPKNATISNWLTVSFQNGFSREAQLPGQSVAQATQPVANQMLANNYIQMLSSTKDVEHTIKQISEWTQNQSLLSTNQKEQIGQLINRFESLPKSSKTIEVFAKQFHEMLVKAFSENSANRLFETPQHGYSSKDQLLSLLKPETTSMNPVFQQLMRTANESSLPNVQNTVALADAQVQSAIDGKAMEQAVKAILKSLGMSYEATLNNKVDGFQESVQSLKPQLLSLVQDAQTSPALREAAEVILARVNGMQLHSGENGHQHQLIMQVPLQFFGKNTDATIQWNGRMKENGKIDANYARILFYLNMEVLQETVVDMQVQNRIVTINLYNEHSDLEQLAEPLKESLKVGLLEKDYQLSGLFIKPFEKTVEQTVTKNSKQNLNAGNFGSGVDYRV